MRILAVCDNTDTAAGLRLAGIESRIAETQAQVEEIIGSLAQDIGIVLINTALYALCEDYIRICLRKNPRMQIVEIPDRNSSSHSDSLAKYVKDAIGISIGG